MNTNNWLNLFSKREGKRKKIKMKRFITTNDGQIFNFLLLAHNCNEYLITYVGKEEQKKKINYIL